MKKCSAHILALRILLGWWVIPISCPLIYAVSWLMEGDHTEAKAAANDIVGIFWNGNIDGVNHEQN